jgi:hypothetical protein
VEDLQCEEEACSQIQTAGRMMRMRNHITDADWLQFLDAPRDCDDSRRIRDHIAGCASCVKVFDSLKSVRDGLATEAERIRNAISMSDSDIDALLGRCLAQIKTGSQAEWSAGEATLLLRLLIEPICGRGTAGATISLARRRSLPAAEEDLTGKSWSIFISNLSDAMSSICGAAAGRLVRRAGFSIAVQEG